jgi:CMP/dCMP kinase
LSVALRQKILPKPFLPVSCCVKINGLATVQSVVVCYRMQVKLMSVPVITIDGPSASGKGTVAAIVAQRLGFHYLDSGSLYRLLALHARKLDVAWDAEQTLAVLATTLPAAFEQGRVWLDGNDVSEDIRAEEIGIGASKVAALPAVRAALLQRQRDFAVIPGLVTDGRDMGSVVFPQAATKIFLTASADERAARRHKQLISKGESANLPRILQDIIDRDTRDAARAVAPLRQEPDAFLLDTTELTIDQAVETVLRCFGQSQASGI